MLTIKTHNFWKVVVLFAVAIGIFLRIFRVNETQMFYGDQALDLLVATHLVEEENPPVVRPYAVGAHRTVQNSPFYFQVLATTLKVVNKPENVVYLFAIASILSILIAYRIGKTVEDARLGMIFAVVTALSFPSIYRSRLVWQPNLIPFITFLSLYLLLEARKRSSSLFLTLSFITATAGFYIHFAFAPIFLGLNIIYISMLVDRVIKKKYLDAAIFIPYGVAVSLILRSFGSGTNSFSFLSIFEVELENILYWPQVVETLLRYRFFEFFLFDIYQVNLVLLLCALIGLVVYIRSLEKHGKDSFFPKAMLLLIFTSVIPTFFAHELQIHYLTPYFIFISLLIGMFVFYCVNHSKALFFALAFFLIIINTRALYAFNYIFDLPRTTELEYEHLIADEIIRDYKEREKIETLDSENFSALVLDTNNYALAPDKFNDCLSCLTSSQYLLLEKKIGGHLVHLIPNRSSYNNIKPNVSSPKYYYLVCRLEHQEFNYNKAELVDQARTHCLPKTNQINPEKPLTVLRETAISSWNGYGNAVVFVLNNN